MQDLYEAASRLVLRGYPGAFELSPRQVVWFSHIAAESERSALQSAAIAARVAQAESKDFDKFMKGLTNG